MYQRQVSSRPRSVREIIFRQAGGGVRRLQHQAVRHRRRLGAGLRRPRLGANQFTQLFLAPPGSTRSGGSGSRCRRPTSGRRTRRWPSRTVSYSSPGSAGLLRSVTGVVASCSPIRVPPPALRRPSDRRRRPEPRPRRTGRTSGPRPRWAKRITPYRPGGSLMDQARPAEPLGQLVVCARARMSMSATPSPRPTQADLLKSEDLPFMSMRPVGCTKRRRMPVEEPT